MIYKTLNYRFFHKFHSFLWCVYICKVQTMKTQFNATGLILFLKSKFRMFTQEYTEMTCMTEYNFLDKCHSFLLLSSIVNNNVF